jgi:hypothetical protein
VLEDDADDGGLVSLPRRAWGMQAHGACLSRY